MVTTRSQDKGLSTPVSAPTSNIEILVPSASRSTARTAASPSITRITRSTPLPNNITSEDSSEIRTVVNKARVSPSSLTGNSHDILPNSSSGDPKIGTTAGHEAPQFPQQLAPDEPIQPALPTTQGVPTITSELTALEPVVVKDDVESTSLPERLKFSPPAESAISSGTHKRFRSEEPEEPATPENKADTEIFQTPAEFPDPEASDESDAAPEVVTTVSRKAANRLSTGRKRRRLEEVVFESKKLPDHESNVVTPTAVRGLVPEDKLTANIDVEADQILPDPYNVVANTKQIAVVKDQAILDLHNPESEVPEPDANTSLTATTDENFSILQTGIESRDRPNPQQTTAVSIAPILPEQDGRTGTESAAILSHSDFKVPLPTKHESKISGLNTVDIGNATALDDTESGSHTEAGSATLTNNSYVTVPEDTSLDNNGETTNSAFTDLQRKNSAMDISLPLRRQESCSKHMSGRQARPRKTMPAPSRQTTGLHDYRQRLLNRNPRTSAWGPPGFRRTRFVGA
ncbi:hypothetical protein LTR84_002382 [Exophiala bonariae]|uniref:Shugoshin C-terminal domain-containing protein n=1 Tax=Exophiala bonariae TaxID=1690606 RepID=A0AAV9NAN2_9EURO|nr:hypothetical protein LTR84_002382 [Exophiala bonariae]